MDCKMNKYLEIRRHSIRNKMPILEQHLNQEGVRLARRVGQQMYHNLQVQSCSSKTGYQTGASTGTLESSLSQNEKSLATLDGKNELDNFRGVPYHYVITSTHARAIETAVAMGFAVNDAFEEMSSYGPEVEDEAPWPLSFAQYADVFRRDVHGPAARYGLKLAALYTSIMRQQVLARFEGLKATTLQESPYDATHEEQGAVRVLAVNHGGVLELGALACLLADQSLDCSLPSLKSASLQEAKELGSDSDAVGKPATHKITFVVPDNEIEDLGENASYCEGVRLTWSNEQDRFIHCAVLRTKGINQG